jgi:hypothetical protein
MLTAREGLNKETQKQPAGKSNRPENAKKFKNRGNELKELLQTQDLARSWSGKRTQFCAQKVQNRAQKTPFGCISVRFVVASG